MRWLPFLLYVSGTILLALVVFSDYAFGSADGQTTLKRFALVAVWPVAALSRKGRDLLFKYGSDV